jgi:hypothetical protein
LLEGSNRTTLWAQFSDIHTMSCPSTVMVGAGQDAGGKRPTLRAYIVETVPGVGSGRGTLERDQSKRSRIVILNGDAERPKRPCGGGNPVLCGRTNDEERAST